MTLEEAPPLPTAPLNARGEWLEFERLGTDYKAWVTTANGREAAIELPNRFGAPSMVLPQSGDEWIVLFDNNRRAQWARLSRSAGVIRSHELLGQASSMDFVTWNAGTDGRNVAVGWMGSKVPDQENFMVRQRVIVGWVTIDETGRLFAGRLPSEEVAWPGFWWWNPGRGHEDVAVTADGTAFHFAARFMTRYASVLRAFRVAGGVAEDAIELAQAPASQGHWPAFEPRLATGERNLLVWPTGGCVSRGESTCQLLYRSFPRGGSVSEAATAVLSVGGARQDDPRAAGNDSTTLTVWRERDPASTIRGRFTPRIGAAGPVLTIAADGSLDSPRTAVSGNTFAVVWVERDEGGSKGRLLLRRYDTSGTVLDERPVVVGDTEAIGGVDIVSRGSGFQVVWLGDASALRMAAVPQIGAAGPVTLIAPGTLEPARRYFSVSTRADMAALVWSESTIVRGETVTTWRVVRITGENTISAPVELLQDAELTPGGDAFTASLGEASLLVAYTVAEPAMPRGGCIETARFDISGTPIDRPERCFCSATGGLPALRGAWDGTQWWLVAQSWSPRLHAIGPDGRPAGAYDVTNTPHLASVVSLPGGIAVLYTRPDHAAGGSERAFVRLLVDESEATRGRAVRH